MAGTKEGGIAAAEQNKKKYGSDFYAIIGAKGGKRGRTGGFYKNRKLARAAGALGGSLSSRNYKMTPEERTQFIRHDKKVNAVYKKLLKVQAAAKRKRTVLART